MLYWFQMGGWGMYAVLTLGVLVGMFALLALVISVVGWFWRPLRVVAKLGGALAVFACILPMCAGFGGSMLTRSRVREAAELVDDPAQKEAILARGMQEAEIPTLFGGGMACLLLMPAALAALVGLTIPAPYDPDDE